MRVFITGATGVIGRRVIPLLVQAGHEVTAAARSPKNRDTLTTLGATPRETDIFDGPSVRRAVAGHDAVVNLATHIPSSSLKLMLPWAWRENDRIRSRGSLVIAESALAAGVPRVIQESFAPMYADGGEAWLTEDAPVDPARYNRSALEAEHAVERFTAAGGTGVVLRFGWFYGPDRFMREMIGVVAKGWSPLPGPSSAYYTSVAHDDAATAVVTAIGAPAGIYNVAEPEPLRREDWISSLAEAAGYQTPRFLPERLVRTIGGPLKLASRSLRISSRKLQAAGWKPLWRNAAEAWPAVIESLK